nr:immunoglobulin light chain junction region [Macaca mulatta]MOV37496.1 immunoglobulin light chain junction region [Macaca mulatta]MOV37557.1 immunoglobulin light chain junction region [Macaca mulatta]MOV37700.1 immunoglobulin light chain junction region [Macaca mulatta]MOV37748.1 immunoglobulin light chain junction region [Macaca mulatta]
CLQYNSEPLTF